MPLLTRKHLLPLLILLWPLAAARADLMLHEQEIKAGMLYNFLKYTDWPASDPSATRIVCVVGGDPFDGHLKPMAGRTVNQHEIVLKQIKGAKDIDSCHLLFIGARDKNRWPELRAAASGKNALTVGDFPGFADNGGMIEFGRDGSRIRVTLDIKALQDAGLRVQDRLLRLVNVIHNAPGAMP